MSDAIEAAAKALISAQRDMFPGGGWFALDDAKTLVIAALTAYEAAKGGGVAWRYFTRRHMPGHHDSGGEVVVPFSNDDEMAAIHAALTSPASGERDAVIEVTDAMVEDGAVAIDALWSEGQDRGPAFAETEREYQAHCRSTARAALVAALRMEGK